MSANNKVAATYHPHITFEQSAAYYAARGRVLGEDPDDGDSDYEEADTCPRCGSTERIQKMHALICADCRVVIEQQQTQIVIPLRP